MEAEFGRFFLADYQCAAPSWPSAASHAEQQQRKPAPPQLPTPVESQHLDVSQRLDVQEEPTGSASSSVQRKPPAATSAAPSHSGNLSTDRAEHGVENGEEINGDTLKGQDSGQGPSGHLLSTPDEPLEPERRKTPEAALHPEHSLQGHSVSFDNDGHGASIDRTPASASSTALSTISAEQQVQDALDLLFADERLWQLISSEVSKSMKLRATLGHKQEPMPGKSLRFRVQVPKPYPGVQYRKSKDLNDKYPRYAKHGSTIVGEVEADSEWVKVRGMYLPMRLGPMQILELLPEAHGGDSNGRMESNFSDASAPRFPSSPGRR
jgi:hypothetical protein